MVVGVYVVKDGLHRHFVLVKGDERAKAGRGEFVQNDGGAGTVSRAGALIALGFRDVLQVAVVAAAHQCFGLRGAVAVDDALCVFVAFGRRFHGDEVNRDVALSLVDELEEGVLRFCSGATPDDDAAWFGQRFAFAVGAFAEAFHVKLLQVLREGLHRVAVGDDGAVVPVEVVVVPGFQRRQPHGHVGHERRGLEVFVHFVRAREELFVSAVAVLQDERQADG